MTRPVGAGPRVIASAESMYVCVGLPWAKRS